MAQAYDSPYRLRKQTVERVFGQIKQARGFRQFLLRGLESVKATNDPRNLRPVPSATRVRVAPMLRSKHEHPAGAAREQSLLVSRLGIADTAQRAIDD